MTDREKTMDSKALYVKDIFSEISWRYDLINNILSFGQINGWRKRMVSLANLPPRAQVLDLCAGTGEVTTHLLSAMEEGEVVALDFSPEMLDRAKKKLLSTSKRVHFCLGDAMALCFGDNTFDCVLTAFSLRNVEDIYKVLLEMKRVTKEGGQVLSLDLGQPQLPVFRQLYFFYFNHLLPFIGNIIQGQGRPYTYLRDSLVDYPNPEALADLFRQVGLKNVDYHNLQGGIVTVHRGEK